MTVSESALLRRDPAAAYTRPEQNAAIAGPAACLKRYENKNTSPSNGSGLDGRRRAFRGEGGGREATGPHKSDSSRNKIKDGIIVWAVFGTSADLW